jgi:hypothetical protein
MDLLCLPMVKKLLSSICGMINTKQKMKCLERNMPQCHLAYNISHIHYPRIEPSPLDRETSSVG